MFTFILVHCEKFEKYRQVKNTYAVLLFIASDLASITSHIHNWVVLLLWLHPFIFSWSYLSTDIQQHIGHLPTQGVPLSVSYHLAFSYCSWGSQGKNTEVACHPLLQWTTLSDLSTMTCPSWVALQGMAHSFIELDKAVVHVIET